MSDRNSKSRRNGAAIVAVLSALFVAIIIYLSGIDGRRESSSNFNIQGRIDSILQPVMSFAGRPASWFRSFSQSMEDHFDTVERLRTAESKLDNIHLLERENKILRARLDRYEDALRVRSNDLGKTIAAWAITDTQGPFKRAKLVSAGAAQGVQENYVAMTHHGLVGRVTQVGRSSSRILLLTDYQSRVPVTLERDYSSAILVGDGDALPKLNFLVPNANIESGDRVLTSGDGGVFPRGLAIGETRRTKDGKWRVYLYNKLGPTDLLQLVGNKAPLSPDPQLATASEDGRSEDVITDQPQIANNIDENAQISAELLRTSEPVREETEKKSTRPIELSDSESLPESLWVSTPNSGE